MSRSGSCLISSGSLYGSLTRFSVVFTGVLCCIGASPPFRVRHMVGCPRTESGSALRLGLFESPFLTILLTGDVAQRLVLDQQRLVIGLPLLLLRWSWLHFSVHGS